MESPPRGLALTSIFFSSLLTNPTSPRARFPLRACWTGIGELRRSPGSRNQRTNRRGPRAHWWPPPGRVPGGPTPMPGLGGAAHAPPSPGPSARAAKASESRLHPPRGGPTSHSALKPRESGAGRQDSPEPGAAAAFIALLRRSQGKPAPKAHPRPPAPAGLSSPERSVARGLPAFPGVRGGRPAAGCAHDGLDHGDVGGRLLDGVVPGVQGRDHRLRAGGGAASGGPGPRGFTLPGAAAAG